MCLKGKNYKAFLEIQKVFAQDVPGTSEFSEVLVQPGWDLLDFQKCK